MPDKKMTINAELELHVQLSELLSNGPLYRRFVYEGRGAHETQLSGAGTNYYGNLPPQIKLFCDSDECKQENQWKVDRPLVHFGSSFINTCSYTCRNCGRSKIHYQFIWQQLN